VICMRTTPANTLGQPRRRAATPARTPTLLQMDVLECGAASLAIVLGYYGRFVPLAELRQACGVSRDGTKASNILKAARTYGLKARGFKKEPQELVSLPAPMIVFWNFDHFLVVEGFGRRRVYLNDPASGPRSVSWDEFDQGFTGVVLIFEPGPDFAKGGVRRSAVGALSRHIAASQIALAHIVLISLLLVIPGLLLPTFTRLFVDSYVVEGMGGRVGPLLAGMALAAALSAALTWAQQAALLRLETRLALRSASDFFWHVLRLPIAFFTQRYGGEIGSRVQINGRVAALLSGRLATTALNLILIVFYAALMWRYDVVLTLIGMCIAALNLVALWLVARKRVDDNRRLLHESGKLLETSMGGLQIIETLKATGAESDFFARWSGYHAKVENARQELERYTQLLAVVPPLLQALNTIVILAIGVLRVMDGHLTIGMLVAFQGLMTSFINPVNGIVNLGSTSRKLKAIWNGWMTSSTMKPIDRPRVQPPRLQPPDARN
jgi:ABC-type bacteriocin/lantibiotic exporter with double-glycine peptidase domain